MATSTETIVTVTDDIDGKEGAETVVFSYQKVDYEIDLGDKNRAKLESALQPFIAAARRAGAPAKRGSRRRSSGAVDTRSVRAWALENGYEVSPRGRVPGSLIEAYRDAGH